MTYRMTTFITEEDGRMNIPALFGKDDSICWSFVIQTEFLPWFYCLYSEEFEKGVIKKNMISMIHPDQFVELLETENVIELLDVQVVLPAHMTKEERWIMRPLTTLWEGEVDDYTEFVYVTSDGKRFSTCREITDENQLENRRMLFPLATS